MLLFLINKLLHVHEIGNIKLHENRKI